MVRVVCRHWPSVEALPHAVLLIQKFTVDDSSMSLPNLLEHGDASLFFQMLQIVDESVDFVHHERLRQYRLAMKWIPSKMTLKQGKLAAMKELYKRYRESVDNDTVRAITDEPELQVLMWLFACEPRLFKNFPWCDERIFQFASLKGRKDVVRWLVKLFPDTVRTLEFAARGGHVGLIKWLMKNTKWNAQVEDAFYAAVMEGHLDIAKFLYHHKPTMSKSYWPLQRVTSLQMMQWLHEIKLCDFRDSTLRYAVKTGDIDMVHWLHDNYSKLFTTSAMDNAAEYGHLELVKFLHAHCSEGCTTNAMDSAARNGHLEVVQWLHENRSEGCTTEAMNSAAIGGHLDVLKWLHVNRTEGCTSRAMGISYTLNHHLDVAKWLHENRGLKLPDGIADRAAQTGDLELLSWLHANGKGVWSKQTMDEAASHGHLEILKFLLAHRLVKKGCTKSAMTKAAQHNHLDVVKWLRANRRKGSTVPAMNAAAAHGHINVVKWLHENGQGGCTAAAMNLAAQGGYLKVVKFLAENYSLDWPEKAITSAHSQGHTKTVKWLYRHLGMKLLPQFAINAARNGDISLLDFINNETDFCRNPTVFYVGCGNHHPEVAEWYKDHYENPRKRKRCI